MLPLLPARAVSASGGRYTFCPARSKQSLLPHPQYTCSGSSTEGQILGASAPVACLGRKCCTAARVQPPLRRPLCLDQTETAQALPQPGTWSLISLESTCQAGGSEAHSTGNPVRLVMACV